MTNYTVSYNNVFSNKNCNLLFNVLLGCYCNSIYNNGNSITKTEGGYNKLKNNISNIPAGKNLILL